MNYDFTGKSIKCDTWEQMLHLAELAEEQGYSVLKPFSARFFNTGSVFFTIDDKEYMCLDVVCDPIEILYTDFINPPLPPETIEVNWCDGCIFHEGGLPFSHICRHPKYEQPTFAKTSIKKLFTTCPLKTKSITIKLKTNDTTGN